MGLFYSLFLIGFILFLFPCWIHNALANQNTISDFISKGLKAGKKTNALIHEKSPYLLQHAFNPVHWFPWGDDAFTKARKEDKPIFLSIGYSTCHWCHVMAHESFENLDIADFLNRHFVCIKVDREERPDLDHIYMAATQALTGHGGWPMSVFLTPDLKPFYAGTYFPPRAQQGMPGFIDVLQSIQNAWQENRTNIINAAVNITEHLKKTSVTAPVELDNSIFNRTYKLIAQKYDTQYGGFGNAPKFPRPVLFNYLLRHYHKTGVQQALDMTTDTLRKMAEGGMYDQLGGGFHRYSVDAQWRVPHFEKMLYDQSQLAISYLEAYQINHDPYFAKIASETLDYVLRDLQDPNGGFYSAEDADSPLPEDPAKHAEGAFYVWSQEEIAQIIGKENAALFYHYHGIKPKGNALSDPHGEFTGKNILYVADTNENTAKRFNVTPEHVSKMITSAHAKLITIRNKRPRPHLDDKVITSWNGLMISALAKGYQVLDEKRYLAAAQKCADFILAHLYDATNKKLYRRYRNGESGLDAVLEDYAFLIQGLLDLYESSFEIKYLQTAITLNEKQINLFYDETGGGFFHTSGDDPTILLRMKNDYDGAEPAGNSITALNLLRLSQITNSTGLYSYATRSINTFAGNIKEYPPVMPQMLVAYYFQTDKPMQVIVAGQPDSPDTKTMLQSIHSIFLPHKVVLLADSAKGQKFLAEQLPFLEELQPIDGKATAYICENYTCKLPTNDLQKMKKMLNK